ncbi:MAG: sugar phosphate isomerase/epimerase [Candidatus Gracilibacteria bacterium]|nr:sugar phosphate isomerase/epimerase [Candidatus Gracilibacteria bacterium]
MKLAISNIAWDKQDNEQVYQLMQKYGFTGLEIAPTKIFDNFLNANQQEKKDFLDNLDKYNIKPIAMQSLLFGKPELKLFDKEGNGQLFDYLVNLIDFGSDLGIKSLIFGSPKNRIYEGILKEEAMDIATDFFRKIGDYANKKGVYICIEPNPEIYGGNFMCNTRETLDFVKGINNPGIKLHLDLGTIIANNEDLIIINEVKNNITHFHISEPYLEVIADRKEHRKVVKLLQGYDGYCSIEMKGTSIENIEKALILVSNIYG